MVRACRGEHVSGRSYSGALGHWVDFIMGPLSSGTGSYAMLMPVDEYVHENELWEKTHTTDDTIIRIARELNGSDDLDEAIKNTLAELGKAIHSDTVNILDSKGAFTYCWNVKDRKLIDREPLGKIWNLQYVYEDMNAEGIIMIDTIRKIKSTRPLVYEYLKEKKIKNTMMFPLYDGGKLMGFVGVESFNSNDIEHTMRLMEEAAYFISIRMVSTMLVNKLNIMSYTDDLTGLKNRYGFRIEVDKYFEENQDKPCTLIILDIDDFKTVNDMHGHLKGDEALINFSNDMRKVFGDKAILGRTGGDEFSIMAKNMDAAKAEVYIKRMLKEEHCYYDRGKKNVFTCSIGYAEYPAQASIVRDLMHDADDALYVVKVEGGNSAIKFDNSIRINSQNRYQLAFNLKNIATNIPGAILVYNYGEKEEILYVNDELIRMFECDNFDDFMAYTGGTFKGIVHPDDYERISKSIEKQTEEGESGYRDYINFRIITKNGKEKNILDNGHLVDHKYFGKIFYVLMVDLDERSI